jgi:hypothetical protein
MSASTIDLTLRFWLLQERLAANLPRARGFRLQDNPDYPHVWAWFDAMDARPAYQKLIIFLSPAGARQAACTAILLSKPGTIHKTLQLSMHAPLRPQVKSDDTTHHLISQEIMQLAEPPQIVPVNELIQRARR